MPDMPCHAQKGPVQFTVQVAADTRAAAMATFYAAAFQKLMASTLGATLTHPDTKLVCADKFEAAAYRAMLDATGYAHVVIEVKQPKLSRRQRRAQGVDFRKVSDNPQNN